MDISSKRKIIKYANGERTETEDDIVNEIDLKLAINYKQISSMIISPQHLEDFTAGYLLNSGIVNAENELKKLTFDAKNNIMHIHLEDNSVVKEMVFSRLKPVGCGGGTILFSKNTKIETKKIKITIRSEKISELMHKFNKSSELFMKTGGVHSAAISDGSELLCFREDIGRHNAIDKVIGNLYRQKTSLEDKVILTSGRISSEIVLKLINPGIQIIISRSAPTLKAIELAEENDITLVGFARSNKFNIYTGLSRIIE
ncbi:MAG: formate dehydrogenase accessory sulfurtransferase FdhD [Candidatus Delongbacteria bacterium]|jgi:FdhD protein|nr:formate dehydrogenase accessory sulfurtransferase FdhD [Candidatus Delongbacteria bacterium]